MQLFLSFLFPTIMANQVYTISDRLHLNDNRHPGQDNDNPSMSSETADLVAALTGTTNDAGLQTVLSTDNSSQGESVTPTSVTHPDQVNPVNPSTNISSPTDTMGTSAIFSPLFGAASFRTSTIDHTPFFTNQ